MLIAQLIIFRAVEGWNVDVARQERCAADKVKEWKRSPYDSRVPVHFIVTWVNNYDDENGVGWCT